MKITALIPDDLIDDIIKISGGKNITESIIIALKEYLAQKRIKQVTYSLKEEKFQFSEGFTAYKVRDLNRES
ncbi:MAG: DUF2191 domain-containing protein [Cyclobacteriaceae bacterium]|nr:DUF2191 domain-containing protein [Cyclobacteriaceae bacterium]